MLCARNPSDVLTTLLAVLVGNTTGNRPQMAAAEQGQEMATATARMTTIFIAHATGPASAMVPMRTPAAAAISRYAASVGMERWS
jgi:hypothetical protein